VIIAQGLRRFDHSVEIRFHQFLENVNVVELFSGFRQLNLIYAHDIFMLKQSANF